MDKTKEEGIKVKEERWKGLRRQKSKKDKKTSMIGKKRGIFGPWIQ